MTRMKKELSFTVANRAATNTVGLRRVYPVRPIRAAEPITRRSFITAGAIGLGTLGLGTLGLIGHIGLDPATVGFAATKVSSLQQLPGFGRAKRCLFLFLTGGPPQHDTWDMKPHAPVEIRGELQPISTPVPGLMVSELFPQLAKIARRALGEPWSHGVYIGGLHDAYRSHSPASQQCNGNINPTESQ